MMPASMLDSSSVIVCPHGGHLVSTQGSGRVRIAGAPVLTVTAGFVVTGCAGAPMPCLTAHAYSGSQRVKAEGRSVLTAVSTGPCLAVNGAPNGPFTVVQATERVWAR